MKQKDLALIIVIIFFGAIISYVISNQLFGSPQNRQQQVDVVQPITTNFPSPDKRFFNNQAYDPTQLIQIGQNNNTNPFNTTTQQ